MSGADPRTRLDPTAWGSGHGEHGFTLIEVMISLGIFAFGLLAVSRMQLLGLRGHHYNESYNTASHLTLEMFETLNNYARTPANFVNGVYQVPQAAVGAWQQEVGQLLGGGASATVGAVQFDPLRQMNTITVAVGWGSGQSVSLTTYLAGQL